ncbi:hypothetical protein [Methylomonas albis]|nr:hypothetical protein [Methylomonas albis]
MIIGQAGNHDMHRSQHVAQFFDGDTQMVNLANCVGSTTRSRSSAAA